MSKFTNLELWNERFGNRESVFDYAGREMKKSACGNPNSSYHPTIDHIRPLSNGGSDVKGNIEICHRATNEEKGNKFPCWNTNGKNFKAVRVKGTRTDYKIEKN